MAKSVYGQCRSPRQLASSPIAKQAQQGQREVRVKLKTLKRRLREQEKRLRSVKHGNGDEVKTVDVYAETESDGNFWAVVPTRHYCWTKYELASWLREFGIVDQALMHYKDLLRLNKDDNLGVRFALVHYLLEQDLDNEARALVCQWCPSIESIDINFAVALALLAFRQSSGIQGGDGPATRDRLGVFNLMQANRFLRDVHRRNPHITAFLQLSQAELASILEDPPEATGLGSVEEAFTIVLMCQHAWLNTAGAMAWLRQQSLQNLVDGDTDRSSDASSASASASSSASSRCNTPVAESQVVKEIEALYMGA